jgi:hypothetical protein
MPACIQSFNHITQVLRGLGYFFLDAGYKGGVFRINGRFQTATRTNFETLNSFCFPTAVAEPVEALNQPRT